MENKDKKMIYDNDPWLMPYKDAIDARHDRILAERKRIAGEGPLADALNNHLYYGMHRCDDGSWVFREWAPHATKIYLIGEFNNWHRTDSYARTSACIYDKGRTGSGVEDVLCPGMGSRETIPVEA